MLIVYIILIILFFWYLISLGPKGEQGERYVEKLALEMDKNFILYTYRNLYVKNKADEYTEIDNVLLTSKGIVIIEVKNYGGWIFADENSKYWMQIIYKEKNKFYNPILQNKGHVKAINMLLESNGIYDIPIFSIIVFTNRCEFKKLEMKKYDTIVTYASEFQDVLQYIYENNKITLNDIIIDKLNELLVNCKDDEKRTKKNLHEKYVEKVKRINA